MVYRRKGESITPRDALYLDSETQRLRSEVDSLRRKLRAVRIRWAIFYGFFVVATVIITGTT